MPDSNVLSDGDILDIVESRRKEYTQKYFMSIPKQEWDRVEYLCCDMYNPYISYTYSYFTHAKAITDSFHVLQWLLNLINNYINNVKKKYQKLDRKRLEEKNHDTNSSNNTIKESIEVYILKKAKWVLLRNASKWEYKEARFNCKLNRYMDTLAWENAFLELDPHFRTIRDLKELYETFRESYVNDLTGLWSHSTAFHRSSVHSHMVLITSDTQETESYGIFMRTQSFISFHTH